MKQEYRDIIAYVDAVSNLAEQLQGDIIKGDKVSIETIICLSKLHVAAKRMEKLIKHVEQAKLKIN
jgi:diketogulonate reductase-like aldo/keto reductase